MKKLVCLTALLVILAGCSGEKKAPSQKSTENTTSTTGLSSSVNANNETTKSSEEKGVSSKNSQEKEIASSSDNDQPYAVNLKNLGESTTFKFKGVNGPTSVTLQQTETGATVIFYVKPISSDDPESKNVFNAEIQNVPTKEIRIFSADGTGIRTVKVNTEIKMNKLVSSEGKASVENGNLYLFNNKNGSVSLVTPNYAGSVLEDQKDVMLEVLQ